MLDPDDVDLGQLCAALDDHTAGTRWWIDPATGEVRSRMDGIPTDLDPADAGWTRVSSTETQAASSRSPATSAQRHAAAAGRRPRERG